MRANFEHLFVLGRPAGGKSEFLDMLYNLSNEERSQRMHIGEMKVLDDFVWLWEKFEEDNIWEKIDKKRLHSEREGHGYVLGDGTLFNFLIEKLNFEVKTNYLGRPDYYENNTLLIEFSRGGEVPYKPALDRFDEEILRRAAILYIEVSHQESVRRNEARYQEKLKSSILAHKTPDRDMERFYSYDDWPEITSGMRDGRLNIKGIEVPFLTLNNEPEIKDPRGLADRYSPALKKLYDHLS
jgi:hypothetical protein